MRAGSLVEGSSASLGLRVTWSAPAVAHDLLVAMLGGEPSATAPGADDLQLDFSEITEPLPYAPPDGFEWSFYQDRAVAYAGPTSFSFQDDASEVRVPLGSGPIVGRLHPRSLADLRSLRLLLDLAMTMALRARGYFHLHAAGVIRGTSCALLPGESGAGKTSSALALMEAGWAYLSDDSLFLHAERAADAPGDDRLRILTQRREFHLTPATLAAYPKIGALVAASVAEPGKVSLAAERLFPGRFREVAPAPTLVLFPRVTEAATSAAEPIVDAVALGHLLMASTMLSVPGTPTRRLTSRR